MADSRLDQLRALAQRDANRTGKPSRPQHQSLQPAVRDPGRATERFGRVVERIDPAE
jgi:hypothetical protein